MKPITILAALICMLAACKKTPTNPAPTPVPPPAMDYILFNNREIGFNQSLRVDLNNDGSNDFFVYTLLVGDPLLQRDYKNYYFGSAQYTDFPVNDNEEVPMLSAGSSIKANAFPGYNWFDISAVVMAQKVISMSETHWEGIWKTASHQYLPLRIYIQGQPHYGWVEVSFNMQNEKMVLHRAAICKLADTPIRAGN